MTVSEFIVGFNARLPEGNNMEMVEVPIQERGRHTATRICDNVAAVLHCDSDDQVMGINVFATARDVDTSVAVLLALAYATDVLTGKDQAWRNKMLERLGLFDGKFRTGKVSSGGWQFEAFPVAKLGGLNFSVVKA